MAQTNRLRPLGEGELPPEYIAYTGETPPPPDFADQLRRHPPEPSTQPPRSETVAASMLLTSLRALSQRALIAVGNLFTLITIGSAWWLWYATMPAPSTLQLVGLALYGLLILALNWLVLRRR